MIFRHTAGERGLWRGWLHDGQSLEISWPGRSFGLQVLLQTNDDDRTASRMLNVAFGLAQVFVPMGIVDGSWTVGDEPQWGLDLSREFGIVAHWGERRWSWRWPFHWHYVSHEYRTVDGEWRHYLSWHERTGDEGSRPNAKREAYPYLYELRSGETQCRMATIIEERWTWRRNILSRFGWPNRVNHSIDVAFDGEVGERSGSWKGGVIGCSEQMHDGETPLETLRRMERTRKF